MVNHGLIGPLRKYRAIEAATVAQAMANEVALLDENDSADAIVEYREYPHIQSLAGNS